MSEPHDLADLIRQAESTAHKEARTYPAEARTYPARKGGSFPFRLVFAVLLIGTAGYSGIKVSDALAPPSQQTVTRDLEGVVDQTQKLIDGIKQNTGELPPTLPNAALASVVQYYPEPGKAGYRLTATVMGIRVSLQPDGRKTTESNVQP